MRLPNVENYNNDSLIETRKITEIPSFKFSVSLLTDKDKIKAIKTIEQIVRGSFEYKDYIKFLRENLDMTKCSYFKNVSNKESRKISIEIHHEPFTLYDISQIVLNKYIAEDKDIDLIKISEEVMKLHYKNKVGLLPLSITVHELIHCGKIFVPIQIIKGNFISLLEEYEEYISEDLKNILECKLKMSREIVSVDTTILEKKYLYLEVDGMVLPHYVEKQ